MHACTCSKLYFAFRPGSLYNPTVQEILTVPPIFTKILSLTCLETLMDYFWWTMRNQNSYTLCLMHYSLYLDHAFIWMMILLFSGEREPLVSVYTYRSNIICILAISSQSLRAAFDFQRNLWRKLYDATFSPYFNPTLKRSAISDLIERM